MALLSKMSQSMNVCCGPQTGMSSATVWTLTACHIVCRSRWLFTITVTIVPVSMPISPSFRYVSANFSFISPTSFLKEKYHKTLQLPAFLTTALFLSHLLT